MPPSNEYETGIRAMPTIFANVYLIDLYKYVNDFYDSNSIIRRCLRSGHYNAVAYKTISKYISQEISNVIVANLDDFLQVEFINTEWDYYGSILNIYYPIVNDIVTLHICMARKLKIVN